MLLQRVVRWTRRLGTFGADKEQYTATVPNAAVERAIIANRDEAIVATGVSTNYCAISAYLKLLTRSM